MPALVSRAAVLCALLLMLAAPALWNGYLFVFFDSEDYVTMSFTWDLIVWRTMPYAVVAAAGHVVNSLWAVLAVQAAAVVWVLHEAVAAFLPRARRSVALLGLGLMLGLFTSLPWITSTLMPDAFTGLAPLGLAVLAFGKTLPLGRRLALVLPVATAIAVHMSHVAVAAGLVLCLLAGWGLARLWPRLWPRPALGLALAAALAGIAAVPVLHRITAGEAVFSQGGRVLQLALFVQNGLVGRYLDEVCPQGAALKLCPHRARLPATADSFLWAPWAFPFFSELGGWDGMRDEAADVVAEIVQRYPGAVAEGALKNFLQQVPLLAFGEGLTPKRRENWAGEYVDVQKLRYPHELDAVRAARQQQGEGIDFGPLNAVQVPAAWLFQLALMVLLVLALRRRDRAGAGLAAVALLALLGNAIVCGAISNPHDRYQNRMIWLAAAAAGIVTLRGVWRDDETGLARGRRA